MSTRTTMREAPAEKSGKGDGPDKLHLLVISPEAFSVIPIPPGGVLTVGRGEADVQLDDPLVSRRHARLHVADVCSIEDLGSANGTRVRDATIAPHVRAAVAPGEAIGIGSSVLVLQASHWSPGARRLSSHVHFETTLRERCAAATPDTAFPVVRLHIEGAVPWPRLMPVLARDLGEADVLATYGRSDYEYHLTTRTVPMVRAFCDDLRVGLRQLGVPSRVGVAWYPRDGRSADALLAVANAQLKPAPAAAAPAVSPSSSPALAKLYDTATRAAAGTINILILGETGVGKEVLATAIHRASPRAARPLVALNCAGLAAPLIESELFGHEKGSFTGATSAKQGLLETAQGGTIFLDEVGELPPAVQAKLLRVLEAREVMPVGGLKPRPIDVRFIAATNRELERESELGLFRRDLYFRLAGLSLLIPPLRDRRSEIPGLVSTFIASAARELGRPPLRVSPEAMAWLEQYDWPGNIRELKNAIERAVVLCEGDEIAMAELPVEKMGAAIPTERPTSPPTGRLSVDPAEAPPPDARAAERQRIIDALAACAGNQSRAARMLNIPRRTFVTKLETYGIPRPQKSAGAAEDD